MTDWGNVVHIYRDCHSARGFRHAGEPDPVIRQVTIRDPWCGGRRVCQVCMPNLVHADNIDTELTHLHGLG